MFVDMKFFIRLLSLLAMGALAEGVVVTASSMQREIAKFNPANVLDGKLNSRWSSKFEFPQNLDIKLSQNIDLKSLEIIWEGAIAKYYTVKVSENGKDWETILVEKNKTSKDAKLIELNEALAVKYLRFDFIEKRNSLRGLYL
ncbi:putative secreted protein [Lentisphaera araneosa HTCC2155]|uniref:Putative secreted protein n=1 Tax=Lentisphaera araneosa HTCC2155 TaxID=313628 RepID=A6DHY2_9BACT|nr:discoidin domain-containing protein [Lentisphaera araneosa]EDM28636.1 putative secreted protein [Lentisphaera araneosa HTCC2155]